MMLTPLYSNGRKFYRVTKREGKPDCTVPSASLVVAELTGENYDRIPLETLLRAELEGTGAHSVASQTALMRLFHVDSVKVPPCPVEYPGTGDEWNAIMEQTIVDAIKFFEEYEVEPVAIEQPALCSRYLFAGTPDMKAWIRWQRKRRLASIDHKRVAALMKSHEVKLRSYGMLDGFDDCTLQLILWFKKGGGVQPVEVRKHIHDEHALASQASVLNWKLSANVLTV